MSSPYLILIRVGSMIPLVKPLEIRNFESSSYQARSNESIWCAHNPPPLRTHYECVFSPPYDKLEKDLCACHCDKYPSSLQREQLEQMFLRNQYPLPELTDFATRSVAQLSYLYSLKLAWMDCHELKLMGDLLSIDILNLEELMVLCGVNHSLKGVLVLWSQNFRWGEDDFSGAGSGVLICRLLSLGNRGHEVSLATSTRYPFDWSGVIPPKCMVPHFSFILSKFSPSLVRRLHLLQSPRKNNRKVEAERIVSSQPQLRVLVLSFENRTFCSEEHKLIHGHTSILVDQSQHLSSEKQVDVVEVVTEKVFVAINHAVVGDDLAKRKIGVVEVVS
ncbi:hypothetical protein Tco_0222064 [Tanacetum coccineum]